MQKRALRLVLLISLLTLFLLILTPISYELLRVRLLYRHATQVKVGDSKTQVEAILGKSHGTYEKGHGLLDGWLFGQSPETWSYSTDYFWSNFYLKKDFPYLDLDLELFAPGKNDIVIRFNDEGKVFSMEFPAAK